MKLYVANLLYEATEADLLELFGKSGSRDVEILLDDKGRSKGCGFVHVHDVLAHEAIEELNQTEFMGRRLFVAIPRSRESRRVEREVKQAQGGSNL